MATQRVSNFKPEKIGAVTESGGNISLASSVLQIGGSKYITDASISVAVDVGAANTRYQIYAVIVASAVQLIVSQNENSSGPTGYAAWKLVGSYYTNGLSSIGFGSFVTIKGKPETEWFSIEPVWNNFTLGTGPTSTGMMKVNGDTIGVKGDLVLGTGGAATGIVGMGIPTNHTVDTNKIVAPGNNDAIEGIAIAQDASPVTFHESIAEYTAARGQIEFSNMGVGVPFTWTTGDRIGLKMSLPVTTSSMTPIEDR